MGNFPANHVWLPEGNHFSHWVCTYQRNIKKHVAHSSHSALESFKTLLRWNRQREIISRLKNVPVDSWHPMVDPAATVREAQPWPFPGAICQTCGTVYIKGERMRKVKEISKKVKVKSVVQIPPHFDLWCMGVCLKILVPQKPTIEGWRQLTIFDKPM